MSSYLIKRKQAKLEKITAEAPETKKKSDIEETSSEEAKNESEPSISNDSDSSFEE